AHTIVRIRRKHHLPAPVRTPRRSTRTVAGTFDRFTTTDADGHVHWTGPYSGRMPKLSAGGRRHNARRTAFRLHHGREPIGRVLRTCPVAGCIAGPHLADQRIRHTRTRTTGATP
ncbi:hypothetical protein ACFWB4_42910, partial [Streptomyces sp. NPDC060001]